MPTTKMLGKINLTQYLFDRWKKSLCDAGIKSDCISDFNNIVECYSSPKRHYHTLQHLYECFEIADSLQGSAHLVDYHLDFAIWFHDIVYNTNTTRSNEVESALRFLRFFERVRNEGLFDSEKFLDFDKFWVYEAIISTRNHEIDTFYNGNDRHKMMLFLDIDMAILGANEKRYMEYERQIRKEYKHLDSKTFEFGRKLFLQNLYNRFPIYKMPEIRDAFEERARENIAK